MHIVWCSTFVQSRQASCKFLHSPDELQKQRVLPKSQLARLNQEVLKGVSSPPSESHGLNHGWRQIQSSSLYHTSGKDAVDPQKNQMGKVNNFPQNMLVAEIQISDNDFRLQFSDSDSA